MQDTIVRLLRCESGGTAIETAFVLPTFFLAFIFGLSQVSELLWTQASLNFAAEAAARCASVNATSCGTAAEVQSYALSHYHGEPLSGSNPFSYSATGCGHTVTASYTYSLAIPAVATWDIPLTTTACFP